MNEIQMRQRREYLTSIDAKRSYARATAEAQNKRERATKNPNDFYGRRCRLLVKVNGNALSKCSSELKGHHWNRRLRSS